MGVPPVIIQVMDDHDFVLTSMATVDPADDFRTSQMATHAHIEIE